MTTFVPRSAEAPASTANTRSFLQRALTAALPAALLLAVGANAQTFSPRITAESAISSRNNSAAHATSGVERQANPLYTTPAYSVAEVQYHLLDSLLNAFSYYSGSQEPLQWDAASNTLVTIKRGPTGESDLLYIRVSTDLGATWSQPHGPLNVATDGLARYPSIKIINKNNSSNRADLLYYFTYPVTIGDGFGTFYQGFLDNNFQPLAPPDASTGVLIDGELNTWSSDARSVVSPDGNFVLTMGGMSNNHIGLRKFDLNSGNLTSEVPPQWNAEHYSDPGSPDSRTAVPVGFDRDANGTFYAAIYSRFPDQEITHRMQPYPAVSQSTDGGTTWTSWDILPVSVLEQYAISQGANPDSTLLPYNQAQDFVVTGNGNFSFVTNLFEVNADVDETVQQLVEVYKNDGQWGMRKIADISGRVFTHDPTEPGDERRNQLANEAQISRTGDGTGILVKWVDLVSYVFDDDINDDGQTPDTLTTSDVFVALRKLGGSDWSASANVTETPLLDRITWIPNQIPNDYKNIPLLTVQAAFLEEDETIQDQLVTGQLNVADRTQYVFTTNFDADALAGVSQGSVVTSSGMALHPAYPNPAYPQGTITIGFDLKNRGQAALDVWNVLGERVANLANTTMEAGAHNARFNVADLPAGTYYYTLTSGGETLTRMFTVVK